MSCSPFGKDIYYERHQLVNQSSRFQIRMRNEERGAITDEHEQILIFCRIETEARVTIPGVWSNYVFEACSEEAPDPASVPRHCKQRELGQPNIMWFGAL